MSIPSNKYSPLPKLDIPSSSDGYHTIIETKPPPQSPPYAKYIKIKGGPVASTNPISDILAINDDVIDVVDAANEDPFSLEVFENLIQLHAAQGKDFIIARVATVDAADEQKTYFSYYAAHHINKVLFRTQPEKGLLHRMKAKNVFLLCNISH